MPAEADIARFSDGATPVAPDTVNGTGAELQEVVELHVAPHLLPQRTFADASLYRYRTAVLEQYKVYVESADRASARRNVANTFFLTVNGLLLTLFGAAAASEAREAPTAGVVCVMVAALCQCLVWWVQARSYRRLGSAKWAVVAELELRLPALAYSSAEWGAALPSRRYTPLGSTDS